MPLNIAWSWKFSDGIAYLACSHCDFRSQEITFPYDRVSVEAQRAVMVEHLKEHKK